MSPQVRYQRPEPRRQTLGALVLLLGALVLLLGTLVLLFTLLHEFHIGRKALAVRSVEL